MPRQLSVPTLRHEVRGINREVNRSDDTTLTHSNQKHKSPLKSIRALCLWCCDGSPHEVKMCPAKNCPLHELRFGKRPVDAKSIRPLKVVRAKCLDCSGGSLKEVSECRYHGCLLWIYRSGHNPKLTGKRPASGHSFAKYAQPGSVLASKKSCAVVCIG
jgi:hypothetical protein